MGKFRDYISRNLLREELSFQLAREAFFRFNIFLNFKNRVNARKKIKRYFDENEIIKIQFGSGSNLMKGFLNTDILGKIPVDITKSLPFDSNKADLLYSSNLVEHIYYSQFKSFLNESYRVLKPGGIHIITTPAIDKIIKSMYFNEELKNQLINDFFGPNEEKSSALLINNLTHRAYMHKFLYDLETIEQLAKKIGFSKVYDVSDEEIPDNVIRLSVLAGDRAGEPIFKNFILIK